jgi:hypothetical protein
MAVELDASVERAIEILRDKFDLPSSKEAELRGRLEAVILVQRGREALAAAEAELVRSRSAPKEG